MNYVTTLENIWFKLAVVQFNPVLGKKNTNLSKCKELIDQTKNSGANLVVLPEMCNSGYTFNDRVFIDKLAEASNGYTLEHFQSIARKNNQYIVYGYPEKYNDILYNSQNIVDPRGKLIGTYRKINLFSTDTSWATSGNLGYISVNSEIGSIGLGICMDMNFDNFTNYHITNNNRIVAISSCWLEGKDSTLEYWTNRWRYFQGIVAIANIYGKEKGKIFSGHSCVLEKNEIIAHCPKNIEISLVTEHKLFN